jgi:hypothetical protein
MGRKILGESVGNEKIVGSEAQVGELEAKHWVVIPVDEQIFLCQELMGLFCLS